MILLQIFGFLFFLDTYNLHRQTQGIPLRNENRLPLIGIRRLRETRFGIATVLKTIIPTHNNNVLITIINNASLII